MTDATHDPFAATDAQSRADELRDLAGPVGATAATTDGRDPDDADVPVDAPDPRTDPDVDDVLADDDQDDLGRDADPYQMRSMGVEPNPTEDDPASYLNP